MCSAHSSPHTPFVFHDFIAAAVLSCATTENFHFMIQTIAMQQRCGRHVTHTNDACRQMRTPAWMCDERAVFIHDFWCGFLVTANGIPAANTHPLAYAAEKRTLFRQFYTCFFVHIVSITGWLVVFGMFSPWVCRPDCSFFCLSPSLFYGRIVPLKGKTPFFGSERNMCLCVCETAGSRIHNNFFGAEKRFQPPRMGEASNMHAIYD